jgi:hypothetical protein
MQDEDNIIDVGEADEQEQEIDLDAEPQQEQPEEEIQVEEETDSKPEVKVEQREEMDDYSDGVQKRIAKLTRKMREAERQKEEAIQYAQSVQTENQDLKSRYDNLSSNYSGEFEKRVKSDLETAQIKLKEAIANNDIDEQVKAQTMLAGLSMDSTRLDAARKAREQVEKQPVEQQTRQPVQQQTPAQTPNPDPKADAWAAKNSWFGTDNAMTYSAFDIHKKLVEDEGYDPTSDDYYSEVDKRIRLEFPHKFGNNESTTAEQPAQTVASARRPATKGRRKTVKLTPSQVAISKRLGVPLEEYAKQLAAKEV